MTHPHPYLPLEWEGAPSHRLSTIPTFRRKRKERHREVALRIRGQRTERIRGQRTDAHGHVATASDFPFSPQSSVLLFDRHGLRIHDIHDIHVVTAFPLLHPPFRSWIISTPGRGKARR